MHHGHQLIFVALSVVIAVFGAWTALDLFRRVRSHIGQAQHVWLGASSLVLGLSIWAMHFVAMLGFDPGAPVTYDPWLTILSLVVAIAATSGALFFAARRNLSNSAVLIAGVAMGSGICAMHYIGMSALRTDAVLTYRPAYVVAAFAVAVAASIAALFAARRERSLTWRAVAAVVLGLAIVGMHYTAMAGLVLTMEAHMDLGGAPPFVLGLAVAVSTLVILTLALLASLYDQRLNVLGALDGGEIGYWELNLRTKAMRISPRGAVLLGGRADQPYDYQALIASFSPEDQVRRGAAMTRAIEEGQPYDQEYHIQTAPGRWRWFNIRGRVTTWSNGRPSRMAGVLLDITDRHDAHTRVTEAERRQRLLIDELNHRVKNTLATVQSIARQTAKGAGSIPAFRDRLEARLMSLSGTHNLLTRSNWEQASLRDLLQQEAAPLGAGQVRLDGPEVQVSPRHALALGMIFHELATNAAKYGALANPAGRVDIAWRLEDGVLAMHWRESGGPAVVTPTKRGFGSTLIARLANAELSGKAVVDYAPDGVRCVIDVPLAEGEVSAFAPTLSTAPD